MYLSSAKANTSALSEHYPFLEEVIINFRNYSNLTLTLLNSVYEIPLFNLSLTNLKVKQEFLSDCGRLKFLGTVADGNTINILLALIFFSLFAYMQAAHRFIIKC